MKVFSTFSIILFITLAFTSCKGERGELGPPGAAGPTGATGVAGPTGPQGNANVKTDTFRLSNANWLWNSQYQVAATENTTALVFTRYYDKTLPALTADILNTGAVLIYFTPNLAGALPQPAQWTPLDYQYSLGMGYNINIRYETMAGKVRLHYFYTAGMVVPPTTLSTAVLPTYKFKIITIAGAIAGRMPSGTAVGYSIEELKKLPYEKVCELLKINP